MGCACSTPSEEVDARERDPRAAEEAPRRRRVELVLLDVCHPTAAAIRNDAHIRRRPPLSPTAARNRRCRADDAACGAFDASVEAMLPSAESSALSPDNPLLLLRTPAGTSLARVDVWLGKLEPDPSSAAATPVMKQFVQQRSVDSHPLRDTNAARRDSLSFSGIDQVTPLSL
jgi:hypothetical protein